MPALDAPAVLNKEFLEIRAKLLDVAASLDRLDRAAGDVKTDPRWLKLQQAIEILSGGQNNRAEQLQQLFSLPYEADWRQKFFGGTNGKPNPRS